VIDEAALDSRGCCDGDGVVGDADGTAGGSVLCFRMALPAALLRRPQALAHETLAAAATDADANVSSAR
jgi:hypothetical protein